MNPMTGEIFDAQAAINKMFFEKLTEVPEHLRAEAEAALKGRDRAMTDISDETELSKWAREVRALKAKHLEAQRRQDTQKALP